MKMNVCFVDTGGNLPSVWNDSLKEHMPKNYIQLTEYGEIELLDLPQQQIIENQLAKFDEMEKEINLRASGALAEVNRRRQEFLAIPHIRESVGESTLV